MKRNCDNHLYIIASDNNDYRSQPFDVTSDSSIAKALKERNI